MRKKVFALIAAACMVTISSCDKAQLEEIAQEGDASLAGTVWEGVNVEKETCTITFISDRDAIMKGSENTYEITYSYKKPDITIKSVPVVIAEGWMSSWGTNGKVKGNKMTLDDFAVLTKRADMDIIQPEEPESEEGESISFTEYSLAGTSYRWTNLDPEGSKKPVLINSNDELQNYIDGTDYPPVDFSKQSLLLANGETPYGIREIVNSLRQFSTDKYKWRVDITLNDATVVEKWVMAILIDKPDKESEIELHVNIIRN